MENNYLFSSTHEAFIIKYSQLCLFEEAEMPMNPLRNIQGNVILYISM